MNCHYFWQSSTPGIQNIALTMQAIPGFPGSEGREQSGGFCSPNPGLAARASFHKCPSWRILPNGWISYLFIYMFIYLVEKSCHKRLMAMEVHILPKRLLECSFILVPRKLHLISRLSLSNLGRTSRGSCKRERPHTVKHLT